MGLPCPKKTAGMSAMDWGCSAFIQAIVFDRSRREQEGDAPPCWRGGRSLRFAAEMNPILS